MLIGLLLRQLIFHSLKSKLVKRISNNSLKVPWNENKLINLVIRSFKFAPRILVRCWLGSFGKVVSVKWNMACCRAMSSQVGKRNQVNLVQARREVITRNFRNTANRLDLFKIAEAVSWRSLAKTLFWMYRKMYNNIPVAESLYSQSCKQGWLLS